MTFGMYITIGAILAPVFIAAILSVINYNTGSIDVIDGVCSTFFGAIAGALWTVTLSVLALAGVGYFLFKQFNATVEKFMTKRKR